MAWLRDVQYFAPKKRHELADRFVGDLDILRPFPGGWQIQPGRYLWKVALAGFLCKTIQ
jgi:hypothetical protein